jgi:hypothetical protein
MEEGTILWDCLFVFPAGDLWVDSPPRPDFEGSTVVGMIDEIRRRLSAGAASPGS